MGEKSTIFSKETQTANTPVQTAAVKAKRAVPDNPVVRLQQLIGNRAVQGLIMAQLQDGPKAKEDMPKKKDASEMAEEIHTKDDLLALPVIELLARIIYAEQKLIPGQGQEAVAWSIINRVLSNNTQDFVNPVKKGEPKNKVNLYNVLTRRNAFEPVSRVGGDAYRPDKKLPGWANAVRLAETITGILEKADGSRPTKADKEALEKQIPNPIGGRTSFVGAEYFEKHMEKDPDGTPYLVVRNKKDEIISKTKISSDYVDKGPGGKLSNVFFDVQPKLNISDPQDAYEKEADRTADAILRASGSNMKPGIPAGFLSKNTSGSTVFRSVLGTQGLSIERSTRSMMERGFGANFSGVRVHTGGRAEEMAQAIHAKAFTMGSDIVFNKGQYAPGTKEGQRLLAHELTHVIQQGQGGTPDIQRAPQDEEKRLPITAAEAVAMANQLMGIIYGKCKEFKQETVNGKKTQVCVNNVDIQEEVVKKLPKGALNDPAVMNVVNVSGIVCNTWIETLMHTLGVKDFPITGQMYFGVGKTRYSEDDSAEFKEAMDDWALRFVHYIAGTGGTACYNKAFPSDMTLDKGDWPEVRKVVEKRVMDSGVSFTEDLPKDAAEGDIVIFLRPEYRKEKDGKYFPKYHTAFVEKSGKSGFKLVGATGTGKASGDQGTFTDYSNLAASVGSLSQKHLLFILKPLYKADKKEVKQNIKEDKKAEEKK